jgi:hypothetical protein
MAVRATSKPTNREEYFLEVSIHTAPCYALETTNEPPRNNPSRSRTALDWLQLFYVLFKHSAKAFSNRFHGAAIG